MRVCTYYEYVCRPTTFCSRVLALVRACVSVCMTVSVHVRLCAKAPSLVKYVIDTGCVP